MDAKTLRSTKGKLNALLTSEETPVSFREIVRNCLPEIFVLKEIGANWKFLSEKIEVLSKESLRIYYLEELKKVENDPEFLAKVDAIRQEYERNLFQKLSIANPIINNDFESEKNAEEVPVEITSEEKNSAHHELPTDETGRILPKNYKPQEEQKSIEEMLSAPLDPKLQEAIRQKQLERERKRQEKWNKVIK